MMKVNFYKCPICRKKFKTLNGWGEHMDSNHPEDRPEGFSTSRYFYYIMTGRTHGTCRTCKGDTEWNENSQKYYQYCTNPECKKKYAQIAKQRMIDTHGKVHLLDDPDVQRQMMAKRKISGNYIMADGKPIGYVGSYEKRFLEMLVSMFEWSSIDIMSPSPHTYYYEYKNEKEDRSKWGKKFYIPDFYIPSLNLEIEIEQNASTNQAFNDVYVVKKKLKDEVMKKNPNVNYLKITENDFSGFFEFLLKAREYLPTKEEIRKNQMELVVESFIQDEYEEGNPAVKNEMDSQKRWENEHTLALRNYLNNESSIITKESMSNEEGLEPVEEGLLSFFGFGKENKPSVQEQLQSWKEKLAIPKNLLGVSFYTGATIQDHMIVIHGIRYTTLKNRIKSFYQDKSIANIFLPKYNALSYRRFEKKKIQRSQIKIDYLQTPDFFALELVCLFNELGKRYRDKTYLRIADQIYQQTWLKESDDKAQSVPYLSLDKARKEFRVTLLPHQEQFIQLYPRLKAQLNLRGYILAFEQGLGKTLTAIALAETMNVDHVYIVCPNTSDMKNTWANEIQKYYIKYEDVDLWRQEVFIATDSPSLFHENTTRFVIVNNESIHKMIPYIRKGKNLLIVDEAHNFRNNKGKRVAQLLELREKVGGDVLVMSGTPIKATPDELVPSMRLIDPTFTEKAADIFSKAFKLHSSLGISLVQDRFGKLIYRKDKSVMENELPEKRQHVLSVKISNGSDYMLDNVNALVSKRFTEIFNAGLSEARAKKPRFDQYIAEFLPKTFDKERFNRIISRVALDADYELHEVDRDYLNAGISEIEKRILSKEMKKEFSSLVKGYLRYRGHCLGIAFGEILPKYRRDMFITMYEENKDMIYSMIEERSKKTLIYSQFKGVVEYINNDLSTHGIGSVMITGSVRNRQEILDEFRNNDSISVLVATDKTMGVGITLTEASQMIFFGPPWREADLQQCSDRIHRIGQTDDVDIYTVTLDTGVELNLSSRMEEILAWSKRMTDEAIVETNEEKTEEFYNLMKENALSTGAMESFIRSTPHVSHRVEDFESGKENVLLVTGLSGSGKSTIAHALAQKYHAEAIELDIFENNNGYSDENLKQAGEPIYEYLTKVPEGIMFRKKKKSGQKIDGKEMVNAIRSFGSWILKWCSSHRNKKWILEGVQIYSCFDFSDVKKYPMIIKGTSIKRSMKQRHKRGYKEEVSFLQLLNWYRKEDKSLKNFKNDIAKESLLYEFLGIAEEEAFNEYHTMTEDEINNSFDFEYYFRYEKMTAKCSIDENIIIDEIAVSYPPDQECLFKNMKFSKIGSAVFANPDGKSRGSVRFEEVNQDGIKHWRLITNKKIRKGELIHYNPNEGDITFSSDLE